MLATWAARDLPARLDVAQTSKLLGFAEHDIQILMAVGKLTPLGDPSPNAPKWFASPLTKTGCTKQPRRLQNFGKIKGIGVRARIVSSDFR
jgi:hypothetical protein